MKQDKKQNLKTTIARVLALVLVAIMILGTLAAGFTALAAETAEPTVLPKQEIYFTDRRITAHNNYLVPRNGHLWVEEGATLTIEGSLQVLGTLINDGTIIISGVTREDGQHETIYDPATLSNQGEIINNGRILVSSGVLYNYPRGVVENKGTLELENHLLDGSVFHNMVRPRGEYTDYATLNNTGTILLANETGTGLYNHSGAVVDNTTGTIVLKEIVAPREEGAAQSARGTYKGKIIGNAPQTQ